MAHLDPSPQPMVSHKKFPTDQIIPQLNSTYERAVVIKRDTNIYFGGSRPGKDYKSSSRMDFAGTIKQIPWSAWAFVNYKTHDNGKTMAEAICKGSCEAVSDGSYKEGIGTAAWILTDAGTPFNLTGCTNIPGPHHIQSAYRSKLGGIFSMVAMVRLLCNYYHIDHGHIHIACDGLGPLQQCFGNYPPSPTTPHFDLITSIRNMIKESPIGWQWHHVEGHQDQKASADLDHWAVLNIQMDKKAKEYWKYLSKNGHHPTSATLPMEGWSMWRSHHKLTSLPKEEIISYSQKAISESYWTQDGKLGPAFSNIDWYTIGKIRKNLPLRRKIWMTKWATGWLPTGGNMVKWKNWQTSLCPMCSSPTTIESPEHLMRCHQADIVERIQQHCQQTEAEYAEQIANGYPVEAVNAALFQRQGNGLSTGTLHQQQIGEKWTARGMVSLEWQKQGPTVTSTTKRKTRRWLQYLVQKYWETAWDIWNLRNEVVHKADVTRTNEVLYQQVQEEYHRGIHLLEPKDHHWMTRPLPDLLKRSTAYPKNWLETVRALRSRASRRQRGAVLNRSRSILRQFLGLPPQAGR